MHRFKLKCTNLILLDTFNNYLGSEEKWLYLLFFFSLHYSQITCILFCVIYLGIYQTDQISALKHPRIYCFLPFIIQLLIIQHPHHFTLIPDSFPFFFQLTVPSSPSLIPFPLLLLSCNSHTIKLSVKHLVVLVYLQDCANITTI